MKTIYWPVGGDAPRRFLCAVKSENHYLRGASRNDDTEPKTWAPGGIKERNGGLQRETTVRGPGPPGTDDN